MPRTDSSDEPPVSAGRLPAGGPGSSVASAPATAVEPGVPDGPADVDGAGVEELGRVEGGAVEAPGAVLDRPGAAGAPGRAEVAPAPGAGPPGAGPPGADGAADVGFGAGFTVGFGAGWVVGFGAGGGGGAAAAGGAIPGRDPAPYDQPSTEPAFGL